MGGSSQTNLPVLGSHYSIDGLFAAQLAANTLFDLCQVIEEMLRNAGVMGKTFLPVAVNLAQRASLATSQHTLQKVNELQNDNLPATVRALLDNTLSVGSPPHEPKSLLERDLWLTYVVRNATAHRLTNLNVFAEQYAAICQSVYNIFFYTIDIYYP